MTTPEARYARLKTTALSVWAAIGVLILIAIAFWAFGRIARALTPFVIAFVIAFLLNWPVRALSARGLKRGTAALLCLLLGVAVLGGALTVLLPPVTRQIVSFAKDAPSAFGALVPAVNALEDRFSQLVIPEWTRSTVQAISAQVSSGAIRVGGAMASNVVLAGGNFVAMLFDFFIALVIAYWALKDLPKLRQEVLLIAGPKYEADAELLIGTVTRVVGGYLKGQTIASLTTGTLATIGLTVIGVPYALVLGIVAFIFNYVPYIGPFTTGLIAGLVGLVFVSPLAGLFAVIVIVVAQNVTDSFVTPRVMSDQVDLHPILVILSLLVGATLFRIPGMLFAIPVAATGKGLFVYYYERRTMRQLSTEDGALFRGVGWDSAEDSELD